MFRWYVATISLILLTVAICTWRFPLNTLLDFFKSEMKKQDGCSDLWSGGSMKVGKSGNIWTLDKCDMKSYQLRDAEACLREIKQRKGHQLRIVFMGDSRIRQLRDDLVCLLTGIDIDWLANRSIQLNSYRRHESYIQELEASGLQVQFVWVGPISLQGGFKDKPDVVESFVAQTALETANKRPLLIVAGFGAWMIRKCTERYILQENCRRKYRRRLEKLLPKLNYISETTPIIWAPQNAIREDMRWDLDFTNKNMDIYNDAAKSVFAGSRVIYWHSFVESSRVLNDTIDGLHLGPHTKQFATQAIFNFLCNPFQQSENQKMYQKFAVKNNRRKLV